MEVLVGKRNIDDELRLNLPDQCHQLRHVVGIDLGGPDAAVQLGGNGVALGFRSRCKGYIAEDVPALGAFMGDYLADPSGSDDKDFAHIPTPLETV
jgi:hypothetical protein